MNVEPQDSIKTNTLHLATSSIMSLLLPGTRVKIAMENDNTCDLNGKIGTVRKYLSWCSRYEVKFLVEEQGAGGDTVAMMHRQHLEELSDHVREKACWECKQLSVSRELYRCSKCQIALYCTKDCQVSHWRKQHKHECARLRTARKSEED